MRPSVCPLYPIAVTLLLYIFVHEASAQGYQRTDLQIPVRDGRTLAADLHRPNGQDGPWPVILLQTPYNRTVYRLGFLAQNPVNPLLASQRYAFLIADWRGFFGSSAAAYMGSPSRGEDGHDTVEWAAAQPWCTGAVGTWGASALGQVQLETALEQPPSLRACVPMVCHLGESYEFWYRGGVYFKNRNDFVTAYYGIGDIYRNNPYHNLLWTFVVGQVADFQSVTTPMLFQSGWYDIQTSFTMETFERVRAAQQTLGLDVSAMLIGPWGHSRMGATEQGELSFPDAEFADLHATLDFFDHHLLELETDLHTGYQTYRLGAGTWNRRSEWPPAEGRMRALHPGPGQRLLHQPAAPGTAALLSDPLSPAPTLFGIMLQDTALGRQGPGDLSPLLARTDTLMFETDPLASPMVIEGFASLKVRLTSDAPDVDLHGRLVHVLPDGRCIYLADGVKRASLRDSYSQPSFLEPGVPVDIELTFTPIAAEIPAGDRLGIIIACANSDLFEVNPQDGSSYLDSPGAVPRSAQVVVQLGVDSGTMLLVPVVADFAGWIMF